MDYSYIFDALENNHSIFQYLLKHKTKEAYLWRPHPEHWCLLEIVCHLHDEEVEDFRQRTKTTLESPGTMPPLIDPQGWVNDRKYLEQDYNQRLQKFLDERKASVQWLRSLKNPQWQNDYTHPTLGPLSAHQFISNWLAHDQLHIRQIIRLQYNYLKYLSNESLDYAGTW